MALASKVVVSAHRGARQALAADAVRWMGRVCVLWVSLFGPMGSNVRAASDCPNREGIGIARVLDIDTADGPLFGSDQYSDNDLLLKGEVVLTFDDGPWPSNTAAVLTALAEHCTKAIFFPVGKHALWHPSILKEVAAAGHTIGGHTWSHPTLAELSSEQMVEEVEKGFSATKIAIEVQPSPFFRFPFLEDSSAAISYLKTRHIAVFSHDIDSLDYQLLTPSAVVAGVMEKLQVMGKGIILMHDYQTVTAQALPLLLRELKQQGYKVVHVRPKELLATVDRWDQVTRQVAATADFEAERPETAIDK